MSIKDIKTIESIIDACIEAHDDALKRKDKKMVMQAIEVMEYELSKLDENKITIETKFLN